uniref:EamA domain-containing protein n=1 Tax=Panagrolaimus superbus TaxID=310955 RepID=A0A914YGM0_9BILA
MGQLDNTSLIKTSFIAFFVVIGVAFSWACATQFSKSALDLDPKKFYAPYSLVWFSTCFMIVCYPVYLIYATTCGRQSFHSAHFEAMGIFGKNGFTISSLFLRVTPFLLLWIGANYCYSQGLGHIAASAASSIMSSNVAMVCILSWVLLQEKIDPVKVLAVLFAVAGVIVISLDKEYTGNILGAGLVVASALFAAFYKVLFKKFLGDATLGQVSAFMTCLGFMNAFLNIIPTLCAMGSIGG